MQEFSLRLAAHIHQWLLLVAFAENSGSSNVPKPITIDLKTLNPLQCGDLFCALSSIIRAIRIVSLPICMLMILWGAFRILTSGGNPENVKQGRQIIWYALIGFLVIISAESIVAILRSVIDKSASSNNP